MKKFAALALCVALLFSLSCSAFAAEIILAHDKLNPNYQPYFEEWAKAADEAIGITFLPVPYPSTDIFASNMRQALPTDSAPQLFTWWSTYQGAELVESDVVMDITEIWDEHADEYSEGLRDAFTFDGKCYGFPLDLSYWFVYYNTSVFEKLGLTPPTTWDELMAICDTMVANDVVPFNLTANDGWTSFIWFEELLLRSDPEAYEALCAGQIRWDDPAVIKAFELWKDMMDKNYFTDASLDLFTDVPKLFNEDRLGMVMIGSWFLSPQLDAAFEENKVGSFLMPPMDGQKNVIIYEVGSVQVAKNNAEPEDTKKLVSYMMSAEGNGLYARLAGKIPGNPSADASHLPPVISDRVLELTEGGYELHNRYWENCPTPIMMAGVECFDAFILDQDLEKLPEKLAVVQAEAEDYWE